MGKVFLGAFEFAGYIAKSLFQTFDAADQLGPFGHRVHRGAELIEIGDDLLQNDRQIMGLIVTQVEPFYKAVPIPFGRKG